MGRVNPTENLCQEDWTGTSAKHLAFFFVCMTWVKIPADLYSVVLFIWIFPLAPQLRRLFLSRAIFGLCSADRWSVNSLRVDRLPTKIAVSAAETTL